MPYTPNLVELSKRYLCFAWPFIVGAATRTVDPRVRALAIPAAALQSLLLCPPPAPKDVIPPFGLPALGGKCPVLYRVRYNLRATNIDSCSVVINTTGQLTNPILGPISIQPFSDASGFTTCLGEPRQQVFNEKLRLIAGNGSIAGDIGGGWPSLGDFTQITAFLRVDGLADNCGDGVPPPVLPPQNPYPTPPVGPDGNPFIPEYKQYDPYIPGPGRPPILVPIVFPPIILKPDISFPVTVPINVGGINLGGLTIKADGTFNASFEITGEPYNDKEIKRILAEIRACACASSGTTVQTIQLPVISESSCSPSSVPLSVQAGAYTPAVADRVQRTLAAAILGCENKTPTQEPEVLLGTGVVPSPAVEQFVTGITPEVVSVRLKITAFTESSVPITTFPAAAQRKFGSFAFSLAPARAGGDYVYVFDQDTYLRLPPHEKDGVIRLLLREGTAWELYDTGERG